MNLELSDTSDHHPDSYRQLASVPLAIAQHRYGIKIDQLTTNRWHAFSDLLQDFNAQAEQNGTEPTEALNDLRDFTAYGERHAELTPAQLGTELHEILASKIGESFRLKQRAASADTPLRFGAYLCRSAKLTAEALGDLASPAVRKQAKFEQQFVPALGHLAANSALLDFISDPQLDMETGRHIVDIDREYYRVMVGGALKHFRLAGGAMLHPASLAAFARHGAGVRERCGMPKYSTLRAALNRQESPEILPFRDGPEDDTTREQPSGNENPR